MTIFSALFLLGTLPVARQAAAPQQPAAAATTAQSAPTAQPTAALPQLTPMLVNDGDVSGEVVLNVSFDAVGSVTAVALVSGDNKLLAEATHAARLFRHPAHANRTNMLLRVTFVDIKSLVKFVAPVYPPIAKAAHVGGVVELVATITPTGAVENLTAVSGPPMLLGSSIYAAQRWVLPPATVAGSPVACHVLIVLRYTLGRW